MRDRDAFGHLGFILHILRTVCIFPKLESTEVSVSCRSFSGVIPSDLAEEASLRRVIS